MKKTTTILCLGIALCTVSYTHLDVYKRQFLAHSAFTSSDNLAVISVMMNPGAM